MQRLFYAVPGLLFGLQLSVAAQVSSVPEGTEITVRTNEPVDSRNADGRIYTGTVDRDVMDRNGNLAIARGSQVELMARRIDRDNLVLDLESIMSNGQRYSVMATEPDVAGNGREREGVGENRRTGKYVGGGALIGGIIGAIAGGGKGAAIGAAAGAASGAGAEMATRGPVIHVPPESLLTFRLERPIHVVEGPDPGFYREGHHYHDYRDEYGRPPDRQ